MSYIVKNCPAKYFAGATNMKCSELGGDCDTKTDCVMKQIVELCKSACIDCSSIKRVTYTQCKDLNNCKTAKILQLLDIQEVWSEQCAEQARQEKFKRSECPYKGIDCAWCGEECE